MNPRQIEKLGVPPACVNTALQAIQLAAKADLLRSMDVKKTAGGKTGEVDAGGKPGGFEGGGTTHQTRVAKRLGS